MSHLAYLDVHNSVYDIIGGDNTLLSNGHKISIYPYDYDIPEDTKEFARLDIHTNIPEEAMYGYSETTGFVRVEFFYNTIIGHGIVAGWANELEKRFQQKLPLATKQKSLQFKSGRLHFRGRDRFDVNLGTALYTIEFCYFRELNINQYE